MATAKYIKLPITSRYGKLIPWIACALVCYAIVICISDRLTQVVVVKTMPVVNSFCCSINLTYGGFIIGWINLTTGIIEIIGSSILISISVPINQHSDIVLSSDGHKRGGFTIPFSFVVVVLLLILLIKICGCIVAILLILGAPARKSIFLLPTLILEGVYITIIAIFWCVAFCLLFRFPGFCGVYNALSILLAINLYLWLCILALCQDIQAEAS